MSWKITSRTEMPKGNNPFGNPHYGYHRTNLALPDGRIAPYFGVLVGDCVHMVGVEEDLTTYLVRQSRPNLLQKGQRTVPITLELPGGFAKQGNLLEVSARKEFAEETGRMAGAIAYLGALNPSPGLSDEQDHIFFSKDLMPLTEHTGLVEATEQDMRVVAMPFGKAFDLLTSGQEPVSAQTVAAMALASRYIES